jgi:phage tail-like protein
VALRDNPYGAFNFLVKLGDESGEDQIVGGFSDAIGLGNEAALFDKAANINSIDHVTLKRGVIGDVLFNWLNATREGTFDPRTVTVTLCDVRRSPVRSWTLQQAQPKKWIGPTPTAKGGGEVAMEELHLAAATPGPLQIDIAKIFR